VSELKKEVGKMNRSFFLLFIIIFFKSGFSQDVYSYLNQADDLIQKKNYASAHAVLDSAIRTLGFQPNLVCPMVDNVIKHYYLHRSYKIFYLKNNESDEKTINEVVVFRYPDRLLKKSLEQNSQFAPAHKLLGDFYNLQLSENKELKTLSPEIYDSIRDKVFSSYLRAVQLGYNDVNVNVWLGKYYKDTDQPKLARQYYQMNIDNGEEDPQTFCYLAEIALAEKKYSQAYNYASTALQDYVSLTPILRYQATRWAALSLYNLGEEARFLDYIYECIQLFPDNQEAYLDLLQYYENKNDTERSQKIIRQMLLNNPYDESAYKYLERYCVKRNNYTFGEKLFEEMMVVFEHSDEAMGNIYRFRGNLMFHRGFTEDAKKLWDISRIYYSRYLPEDSPVLKQVGDISRESSLK
jgi:tetratricopeptide (TPR) repeat protein